MIQIVLNQYQTVRTDTHNSVNFSTEKIRENLEFGTSYTRNKLEYLGITCLIKRCPKSNSSISDCSPENFLDYWMVQSNVEILYQGISDSNFHKIENSEVTCFRKSNTGNFFDVWNGGYPPKSWNHRVQIIHLKLPLFCQIQLFYWLAVRVRTDSWNWVLVMILSQIRAAISNE